MTNEDFERFQSNEPFAYISELSVVNATHFHIVWHIDPGVYDVVIYYYETGNVTIYPDFQVPYPKYSHSGLDAPWDVVAIAIMTALVAMAGTYAILRMKKDGLK